MNKPLLCTTLAVALVAAAPACDRTPTGAPSDRSTPPGRRGAVVVSTSIGPDGSAQAGEAVSVTGFPLPEPDSTADTMAVVFDSGQARGPMVLDVAGHIKIGDVPLDVGAILQTGVLRWNDGTQVFDRVVGLSFGIVQHGKTVWQSFTIPLGDSLRFVDRDAANHKLVVSWLVWPASPESGGSAMNRGYSTATGPIQVLPSRIRAPTGRRADSCALMISFICYGGGAPPPPGPPPSGGITVRAYPLTGRDQAGKLSLSCTATPAMVLDSVERGATLSCAAKASVSNATVTSLAWQFADTAGHVIQGPAGDDHWTGPLVVPGVIRVSGRVDSSFAADSMQIKVRPRPWTDKPLPLREVFQRCGRAEFGDDCPLWYPPRVINELAEGRAEPNRDWGLNARAEVISAGPNTGWGYINGTDAPIPYTEYLIHYSDLFQKVRDPWWQQQSTPDCHTAEGVHNLFNAARSHERLHYTMLADIYGGAHDERWNQQLEAFVRFGTTAEDWQTAAVYKSDSMYSDMVRRSGRTHDYPNTNIWVVRSICPTDLRSGPN